MPLLSVAYIDSPTVSSFSLFVCLSVIKLLHEYREQQIKQGQDNGHTFLQQLVGREEIRLNKKQIKCSILQCQTKSCTNEAAYKLYLHQSYSSELDALHGSSTCFARLRHTYNSWWMQERHSVTEHSQLVVSADTTYICVCRLSSFLHFSMYFLTTLLFIPSLPCALNANLSLWLFVQQSCLTAICLSAGQLAGWPLNQKEAQGYRGSKKQSRLQKQTMQTISVMIHSCTATVIVRKMGGQIVY